MSREGELALLLSLAEAGGPRVALLQAPAGMGKTTLLAALQGRLAARGVAVEPTPAGFLAALEAALGTPGLGLSDLASRLEPPGGQRTVILVDEAESLHLLATWLRRELAPRLPASVALVLAGRGPAPAAWERERPGEVLPLELGPLPREAVAEIAHAGPTGTDPDELWEQSAGHPLALTLLMCAPRPVRDPSPAGLARELLRVADDPALMRAVEAASVLRRLTRPLLATMEPELDADAALAAIEALPFVKRDEEGLRLAEPVRAAQAARLAALEPERHARLRTRAAATLAAALAASPSRERWRFAADLLFLVPNPAVRSAFFPPETALPPVDLAGAADAPALDALAALRAPEAARVARLWREALPHRTWVARDGAERPLAFYVFARNEDDLDALADTARRCPVRLCRSEGGAARDGAPGGSAGRPTLALRRFP